MKTTHRFLLLIVAMTTSFPLSSFAQLNWEKCGTFPNRISVVYFYNTDLGFVCIGVPAGPSMLTPAIYRTGDGGKTWSLAKTPENGGYGVNDIFMEDESNGWAAADDNNGRVWHTTDGGASWESVASRTGNNSVLNSIRRTAHGLVISDFLGGEIELSGDNGKTFQKVYQSPSFDYILGMDFTDSVHGAASTAFRSSDPWSYTSDGGLTWNKSDYTTESWTLRAMKGTSLFFAIPEGFSNTDDYLSEVMRSNDYGKSWKKIFTLPFRGTSDVEICGSVLYIQTGTGGCLHCNYPEGLGIYRSTDSGMTWHGLGGPGYWSDTRFAVTKTCFGTTIYCCDQNNNVFRAFDSTQRVIKLDASKHLTIFPPDEIKIYTCEKGTTEASFYLDECYKLVITNEKIEGRDSQFFSFSDLPLPYIITDKKHSILITTTLHLDSGKYDANLHLRGYYDYGTLGSTPFDTLLPLQAFVSRQPLQLIPDKYSINFKPITTCQNETDETITLKNNGCDTLSIVSGPGSLLPPFSYNVLSLPITLPPDKSQMFHFYFKADSVGSYISEATFIAESRGATENILIPLEGKHINVLPKLQVNNSSISFPTFSLCDAQKNLPIMLANSGCDTIRITAESDARIPEFTVDPFTLPLTLAPGESITRYVHFLAKQPGNYFDTLIFNLHNGFAEITDTILLLGSAIATPPELSIGIPSIDLGLVSTCEPSIDTSITIMNTDCNTLSIISAPGTLPPEFTMDTVSLPLVLVLGASYSFHFHFHPSGSGDFPAHLEFVAERFGVRSTSSVSLDRKGVEGVGLLRTSPQSFVFSPMSICSVPDTLIGVIKNPGCDTLIVSSIALSEDSRISLSSLTLPAAIAPNGIIYFSIYFRPMTKGICKGQCIINAHTAHGTKTDYISRIPVSGSVEDGTRLLSVFPSDIDFGARKLCDNLDSAIKIINTGCDTVTIDSAIFNGDGYKMLGISLPIVLSPGNTVIIPIAAGLDTTNGKNFSDASLVFQSDVDNLLPQVRMHQQYIFPAQHEIMLSEAIKNGAPGDTIQFNLEASDELQGVQTFDLDLSYDTDLLEYINASGPNTVSFSEGHLHLSNDRFIASNNGILTTLAFQVYLTKANSTNLIISNAHLNNFDPSFEECLATASVRGNSPIFTSTYSCGDKTISDFLQGSSPFQLVAMHPDPAIDQLTLDVDSKVEQEIQITIFDAFGKKQLTKQIILTKGNRALPLDLTMLTSGMYIVDISNGASRITTHFVKIQ